MSQQAQSRAITSATMCAAVALALGAAPAFAGNTTPYIVGGNCAKLPQDRATEFHGNPKKADLFLGMAGNQWTVFENVLRAYNGYRGIDNTAPDYKTNYTQKDLRSDSRDYYVELIPPGTIRDQIKSACMTLGNDEVDITDRNFLPLNIQVDFDVFTSTTYSLMQDLALNGYITQSMPYTKNKLALAVQDGNPHGIGTGALHDTVARTGNTTYDKVADLALDLLDPNVPVSEVDHINEGIHTSINQMYQAMDAYVRAHGTAGQIAELNTRLAAVATPQDGSPGKTRPLAENIPAAPFVLANNSDCKNADGTLRMCEYAILNKANTYETRVHHVETPERVRADTSWTGPQWVTELVYAQTAQAANPNLEKLVDVVVPGDVNKPQTYSIALLATSGNPTLAQNFIDWVRSPAGQDVYVNQGGFLPLTDTELAGGECYSVTVAADGTRTLNKTTRVNNTCP